MILIRKFGEWAVVTVDPVTTTILAALAAGAVAGVTGTATQAIKDGYAALKGLLKKKFAGNSQAEETLKDHEADPEAHDETLAKHLVAAGANQDDEVKAAAEAVLVEADKAGVKTKYNVKVTGGKVGIIGDHGTVTMN